MKSDSFVHTHHVLCYPCQIPGAQVLFKQFLIGPKSVFTAINLVSELAYSRRFTVLVTALNQGLCGQRSSKKNTNRIYPLHNNPGLLSISIRGRVLNADTKMGNKCYRARIICSGSTSRIIRELYSAICAHILHIYLYICTRWLAVVHY
jgi:hypothetical protein